MKFISFVLFIIFDLNLSFGQNYISWALSYNDLFPISVKKTNDNYFLISAYLFSDFYFPSLVIKVDSGGNKIWKKIFSQSEYYPYIAAIEETNGGDYLLVGSEYLWDDKGDEGFVSKIDKEGNILWKKNYGEKFSDFFNDIVKAKEGGYILVGGASSNLILYPYNLLILKIDENGNLIWKKYYSSFYGDEGYSIVEDDGYVIVGTTNNGGNYECDLLILKISESGEKIWHKSYKGFKKIYPIKIIKVSDGNYVVIGYTQDQNYENKGFISKFNKNGELIWTKLIDSKSYLSGATEKKDGIMLSGVLYNGDQGMSSFFLNMDLDGNILKQKGFQLKSSTYASDISKISDNDFILIGGLSNNYCCDSDIFILNLSLNSENQQLCHYEFDTNITLSYYSLEDTNTTISEISKPMLVYDSYWSNVDADSKSVLFCSSCPSFKIFPEKLENAKLNNYYAQIISAVFGEPPYKFSLLYGKLPPNLKLTEEGLLSGTPNETGKYDFKIKVEDKNGCVETKEYSIEVKMDNSKTWLMTIDDMYDRNFSIKNEDGNFAFIGQLKSDISFLIFDNSGNILKKKIYEADCGSIKSVIETSKNDYLILYKKNNLYDTVELLKVDKYGNIIFNKSYFTAPQFKYLYIKNIIETNSGAYILSGTFTDKNDFTNILIIKISENGDVLWSKIYKSNFENSHIITKRLSDGNILIASTLMERYYNKKLLIFKIDEYGNIIWEKFYGFNDEITTCNLEESSENFIYLIGDIKTEEYLYSLLILKFNQEGNLIWQGVYTSMHSYEGIQIIEGKNNSMIAIGGFFEFWYDPCGHGYTNLGEFILNISSDGRIINQRNINFYYDNNLSSFSKIDDGYVLSGIAKNEESKSIGWILKLDEYLNIEEPCYIDSKISFTRNEKEPLILNYQLHQENAPFSSQKISINYIEKEISTKYICPNEYLNFKYNDSPIEKNHL